MSRLPPPPPPLVAEEGCHKEHGFVTNPMSQKEARVSFTYFAAFGRHLCVSTAYSTVERNHGSTARPSAINLFKILAGSDFDATIATVHALQAEVGQPCWTASHAGLPAVLDCPHNKQL